MTRLACVEHGSEGTPILCIHGITANAHSFDGLAEALAPRRVVAVDLRGRGESPKPESGYDVGTHVEDVGAVLEELGAGPVPVIGWSLGAKVALALAATHPGLVERLVLIDPPVETPPETLAVLRRFWERLDNTYESVDAFLEQMRAGWRFTAWSPQVERYLRADVEQGADGIVRHRIARRVPEAEVEAEARFPTRSFYAGVRCPVLILRAPEPLVSEGDQVLSPEDAAEMAAAIPDARLVVVAGTNHFGIVLGNPPVAAIEAFLARA